SASVNSAAISPTGNALPRPLPRRWYSRKPISPSMRVRLGLVIALTVLCAPAAEQDPAFVSARDHYTNADFRRAAAGFQFLCDINKDAEACYWAGLSYERLADIAMPFGCRIEAKARGYYSQAVKLEPRLPVYR